MQRLVSQLDAHRVPYQLMEHAPIFTGEQAALVRGTPLDAGAKALVCKCGETFAMFVLPANLRLSTRHVRRTVGIGRLRFATDEELLRLTGLTPGCVPPFGNLFDLPTWCDTRLANAPRIYFSAGDHRVSIGMDFADYHTAASPAMGEIAR